MKDDLASTVSVSHCVRDSEIAEIEALISDADPGAWRVVNGQLERYTGPFERPVQSLAFAAKAVEIVPRLIKGIRALEKALETATAIATSARIELQRERSDRSEDAKRRAEGKTGPENGLPMLAEYLDMFAKGGTSGRMHSSWSMGQRVESLLRRWAGGASIRCEIDLHAARKHAAEYEAYEKALAVEQTEIRERLRTWVARLEAGDVPAEMAEQWARMTKDARKRYLAEKRSQA